ncbi:helix-turn-helix transcriptional regulator [Candidatus Kaiserbacteria bacterium]|nr:helix-turn-helix transcriptional regulator [Candidatus Kaiserbacteria bacterium]
MQGNEQNVANRVYDARKDRNVTQEELAAAVGVTRQTIISIEKGNYVPSVLLAMKLARFFGQPVETLFSIRK